MGPHLFAVAVVSASAVAFTVATAVVTFFMASAFMVFPVATTTVIVSVTSASVIVVVVSAAASFVMMSAATFMVSSATSVMMVSATAATGEIQCLACHRGVEVHLYAGFTDFKDYTGHDSACTVEEWNCVADHEKVFPDFSVYLECFFRKVYDSVRVMLAVSFLRGEGE